LGYASNTVTHDRSAITVVARFILECRGWLILAYIISATQSAALPQSTSIYPEHLKGVVGWHSFLLSGFTHPDNISNKPTKPTHPIMQLKTTLIGSGTLALAASLTLGMVARDPPTTGSTNIGGSKGVLELNIFPNTDNVFNIGDVVELDG